MLVGTSPNLSLEGLRGVRASSGWRRGSGRHGEDVTAADTASEAFVIVVSSTCPEGVWLSSRGSNLG